MIVFKLNSAISKIAVGSIFILVIVFAVFGAKWNFANSVSTRVDSKEIADIAVALGPDDPQTRYAAAVLYEKTFDPSDLTYSMSEFEFAAANSPNNYLSWLALGGARGRSGDYIGAESALRKALELAPNYADVQWAYGNSLVRNGKISEGFAQIGKASAGKQQYIIPSVVTAMTLFDGDLEKVRLAIGDSPLINSALATYLVANGKFADGASSWERIPLAERTTTFKDDANRLINSFVAAKQFRSAAQISRDITPSIAKNIGEITDGGFENGVKIKDVSFFEWKIADGTEPQIAISNSQQKSGANSLTLAFETKQTKEFRSVSQNVPVEPGSNYIFSGHYRSELKATNTLRWEIVDIVDGKILGKTDAFATNADWAKVEVRFSVPATLDAVVIRLARADCATTICPISGRLWIDDVLLAKF